MEDNPAITGYIITHMYQHILTDGQTPKFVENILCLNISSLK